jgi:hypothetical protein
MVSQALLLPIQLRVQQSPPPHGRVTLPSYITLMNLMVLLRYVNNIGARYTKLSSEVKEG